MTFNSLLSWAPPIPIPPNICKQAPSRAGAIASRLLLGLLGGVLVGTPLTAQTVTPDATLPSPSQVTPVGNQFIITGGTQRNSNLFHSFSEFSPGNRSVTFQGFDPVVQDIFARVTGSNSSNINGILQVLRSRNVRNSVNLFLINPNGVIFGPTAVLNVPGSVLVTTGDRLTFADGSEFNARSPQAAPLLSVSVPTGVQFNASAGAIVQNSVGSFVGLSVPAGRTLALLGGSVALSAGGISARGGQIVLGGVTTGQVSLDRQWNLGFGAVQQFGPMALGRGVTLNVGAGSTSVTAGTIGLWGDRVQLNGGAQLLAITGAGNGGQVVVQARQLSLSDRAQIQVGSSGVGNSRGMTIVSSEQVELTGAGSGLFLQVGRTASGTVGTLQLTTPQLTLRDGAQIALDTFGAGDAGTLEVTATDMTLQGGAVDADGVFRPSTLSAFAFPGSSGDGGNITLRTGRLVLQGGATIQTTTQESGAGGRIEITAGDRLEISGFNPETGLPSALLTFSGSIPGIDCALCNPNATGPGGNLRVSVPNLVLRDRGLIATGSVNLNQDVAAGDLQIEATAIALDNASIQANTNSGNGGNVTFLVRDLLLLRNSSQISTSAGTANRPGNGGNITINNPDDTLPDGFIVSVINENNDITANAFTGNGGNVTITTQGIFGIQPQLRQTDNSDITASSEQGINGTILINVLNPDPNAAPGELPTAAASAVPAQGCAASSAQSSATFFASGRGGLPSTPYEPLSNTPLLDDLRLPVQLAASALTATVPAPVQEANDWSVNGQGQVVLMAMEARAIAQCSVRSMQNFLMNG